MNHLHRFKEMLRIAQMLPEGDIPTPNAALQVEWFYLTFHRSDRADYLRGGRKLCDEMLASLAEYFESGFDARVADGSLRKLRDEQVRVQAQNEYRHELQSWYHDKLKRLTNNKKREYSWRREDRDGSSHGGKSREQSAYRERKPDAKGHGERKTTHEQAAKNKPCHVHGPVVLTLKISAVQTTTTTTIISARTTPITTTNATLVAKMSPQRNIVRRN